MNEADRGHSRAMVNQPAVLFDVDGTLVDSNYLHVHAWSRAFAEAGITVESWRIHRSIGMDGTRLLESLSGDADHDAQQRAEDLHSRYYKEAAPLLKALPGARELLERVSTLGLQVVLASSASEEELSMSRAVCGRAGVPAIGLLSGGVSREELEKAGAEAVFDNPQDLCDHIGSTTIATLSGQSVS